MTQTSEQELIAKLRQVFKEMTVYKSGDRSKLFSSLGIPSFMRDWLVMRFSNEDGEVNSEDIQGYIKKYVPRREQWESLKNEMINEGQSVRFLAKLRVYVDVGTGEVLFSLPDLGFPSRKYEARIETKVVRDRKEQLLSYSESWGIVELEWRREVVPGRTREEGRVVMTDFKPFCPYLVDLDYYQCAREEFTVEEWVDILLAGIDYNPQGYLTLGEKLTMLCRLLPFVEKRINLIELAPKGTGKSYVFSQLSKYGWLVSGGSVSRARLFYDNARLTPGLVSRHDYVALDEIQNIKFSDEEEIRGALKGYLESGEYRVGDYRGIGEAGFVLLGNIDVEKMDENINLFTELPSAFQESALLDRFHGFIKGWDIPRMRENLKVNGWALNSEYLSEILHALRGDVRYRAAVDEMLSIPRGADTRDVEAIKRTATGLHKIIFPHFTSVERINRDEFNQYCLEPAKRMRGIIRNQLHMMDPEYSKDIPQIECRI